jgi:hypothetical protein
MHFEDRVASFSELERRLRVLDQDAGVRLIGESGREEVLAFVTRSGLKYTLMLYSLSRTGAPGKRLQTLEFEGFDGLEKALRKLVKGRLRAWVY